LQGLSGCHPQAKHHHDNHGWSVRIAWKYVSFTNCV
jgi:hypothetical protein